MAASIPTSGSYQTMPDGLIAVARGTQAAVDDFLPAWLVPFAQLMTRITACCLVQCTAAVRGRSTGLAVGTSVMMAAADGEQRMMSRPRVWAWEVEFLMIRIQEVFCLIDISYLIFSSPGGGSLNLGL